MGKHLLIYCYVLAISLWVSGASATPIDHEASFEEGLYHLRCIKEKYPDLIPLIPTANNDGFSPQAKRCVYPGVGICAPEAIRCIKLSGELRRKYGEKLTNMHLVELGGGNGLQCKVLSSIISYASYTIVTDAENAKAIASYVEENHIPNVHVIDIKGASSLHHADLIFSSLSFSKNYYHDNLNTIDILIKKSTKGFFSYDRSIGDTSETWGDISRLLLSNDCKGLYSISGYDDDRKENIQITWKHSSENEPSVLKDTIPQIPINRAKYEVFISYILSGGRLGDNLMAYLHAKWISMKYGIPLIVKSFPGSNWFKLSTMDHPPKYFYFLKRRLSITKEEEIDLSKKSMILQVPYFPDCKFEYDMLNMKREKRPFFDVDWEDSNFKQEVHKSLAPLVTVNTVDIPKDCLSVAMHVRRGGSFDDYEHAQRGYPLKFPPIEFFVACLQKIAKIYSDRPLYVYLFTDHLNPEEIINELTKNVHHDNIHYDWNRQDLSTTNMGILKDFYSMTKFDCLIRSTSNFSAVAAKIGEYALEFYPKHAYFKGTKLVIDETQVNFKAK